jgi:hypothetical protein
MIQNWCDGALTPCSSRLMLLILIDWITFEVVL